MTLFANCLRILPCLFLLILASTADALDLSRYMPHSAGNQWSYQNNTLASMTSTLGSPVLLPGGVTTIPATIINSSEPGYTSTYSTMDATGLSRHQEFISSVAVAGYGNTSATAIYTPALIFAPLNVTVGNTYTSTGTASLTYTNVTTAILNYSSSTQIVGFENVSSGTQSWPALKTINSVTISGTVNGQFITSTTATTSWHVDGIGSVQMYSPNRLGIMEAWKLVSTNVSPPPALSPTGGTALNLTSAWNLLGNSANAPLTVASAFGNAANVATVWKWVPATGRWAFYTPMQADNGAAYAASKGYDFLTTINGGEGFWVNANTAFTAQLPAGIAITTGNFKDQLTLPNKLPAGWSLISVGDNPTPAAFNNNLAATPPTTGTLLPNLTTLWAWDSTLSNWYFYAPSLDNSGALATYIASKSYLNFGTRTLGPAMGFWVNHP